MELHNLPKITAKRKKRLGRGYASGRGGHTVGKGQKGQKTRSKVGLFFEGTKFRKSLVRRLPLLRGKGKLKSGKKPVIVNVKYLNLLPADSVVDIEVLAKHKIVDLGEAKKFGVKILGEGKLGVGLKVALPCSKGAAEKIKEAGGEIAKKTKSTKDIKPACRQGRGTESIKGTKLKKSPKTPQRSKTSKSPKKVRKEKKETKTVKRARTKKSLLKIRQKSVESKNG